MRRFLSMVSITLLALSSASPAGAGIPEPPCDLDGIPDAADNCMCVDNPTQCDDDQDGYGNHCDADFDNGGAVGATDFPIFVANWGQPAPNVADLDCGGAVGATDFPLFTGAWGQPPGPSGLQCAGTIPCP